MIVAQFVLAIAAALLLVPAVILLAQVIAALPARNPAALAGDARPRVAVIIPAHDEELVIAATLQGVRAQLAPGDRLLVIADNCRDATAAIAAAAGAEVVERRDAERRGKGYALDFGVRSLAPVPPEVLVVVDADCSLTPGAIDRIARQALATGRPAQALYLMRAPADAAVRTEVSLFAWMVKNHVRPLGGLRLGMPCQLMGTGMAFPWALVAKTSLATGSIAEDVLLGIALAQAGAPPLFCPDALVQSELAATDAAAASQRRRWEHGNLGLILGHAPRLLWLGITRHDARLIGMALDLAVPPLALLVLLTLGVDGASGLVAYLGGSPWPFTAATIALGLVLLAVALAWLRFGQAVISLFRLTYAPLYALAKIPLYVGFFTRRQVEWIRTRRDA